MFIIDDIVAWIIGRFMDWIFPTKKENENLIEALLVRDREIGRLNEEKEWLLHSFSQDKDRIIKSLKRRGISVEKLISKYDKPLVAILISYSTQLEVNEKGKLKKSHFVKEELKQYDSKYLGGTDAIIPPSKVPKKIKNNEDLRYWFEKRILKGRHCKVKFLSLIDLRNKSFWKTYLPYEQREPKHHSIGEVLKIDDLFTESEIERISISEIIREGDIVWLASSILEGKELNNLLRNQKKIENSLRNPSLRELADDQIKDKLTSVLEGVLINPEEISEKIVEEAKFWNTKLN